jgi:transposase
MSKFGIDWSEQHHNLCIRNSEGAIVSRVEFKHTLQGFRRFDERRKLGVPPSECLVAIETAYNLLVDFLLDRGYPVYLIPPQATKGCRNRQRSIDAHTDDTDAALLSSILRVHPGR